MTTYVLTVPGTFLDAPPEGAQEELVRALKSADPHKAASGEAEELDILTVYDGTPAFSLHLEVEADTKAGASETARSLITDAMRTAGIPVESAPLGDPVITGIAME
jgi:hypothetical protein